MQSPALSDLQASSWTEAKGEGVSVIDIHDGIRKAKVDDRVWFVGERNPYRVQARDKRFLVCTKPFAARKTVIYTVVDLLEQVRGTEDLIFCMGFEDRKHCEEALARLASGQSEVSHRNRVALLVLKITGKVPA